VWSLNPGNGGTRGDTPGKEALVNPPKGEIFKRITLFVAHNHKRFNNGERRFFESPLVQPPCNFPDYRGPRE